MAWYQLEFLKADKKFWYSFDFGMFSLMTDRNQELLKESHLVFT
jgi:hypothetical protein